MVDPDLAPPPNTPARRARVAAALLARVHRACRRAGAATIRKEIFGALWDDFLFEAVRRAGYSTKRGGLVELQRIDDLAQLLDETRATFEVRLRASRSWADWEGEILLVGGPLGARMRIAGGHVAVAAPDAARSGSEPLVRIAGTRAAVTRIARGASSPVEEHLQREAVMTPTFSTAYGELSRAAPLSKRWSFVRYRRGPPDTGRGPRHQTGSG